LRRLFQFAVEYYGGVVVWPATDKETALKQKVASLEFELKMAKMELPERQLEKVG
jgi:hypothetical protein